MISAKKVHNWNTPDIRKLIFHAAVVIDMALLFFFATTPGIWNFYGNWLPAWPLPVDLFLFAGLYYFLFRPPFQEFLTKVGLLSIFGALFGYFVLPSVREILNIALDQNQTVFAITYVVIELLILYLLVRKIHGMLRVSGDIETTLRTSLAEKFGTGWFGRFAYFEARIWYYGIFMRKGAQPKFEGKEHFSYAQNDGNVHHQFCLVMLLIFDLPISHFITHFLISGRVALLMTVLAAWNVLYVVAQYRASFVRPISIDERYLYIRYGVFFRDRKIPLSIIARAVPMKDNDERVPGELRYRQFGSLNVAIELHTGSTLTNFFGVASPIKRIALSIDDPVRFLKALNLAAAGARSEYIVFQEGG